MRKRQLHHLWTNTQHVKPGYFLAVAAVSATTCVFALRANNQHMIKLRSAVYAADQANADVETPLRALQSYVTTHMNTNLNAGKTPVYPPIQLKYTYDRLVRTQSDQVAQSNTTLYSAAQAECERLNPTDFSGRNRVPCIEQYVQSHDTSLPVIPDALYKFSFISPRWSPDLAGWSMVLAVSGLVLAGAAFIINRWLRG
jgi:hypothetical protein